MGSAHTGPIVRLTPSEWEPKISESRACFQIRGINPRGGQNLYGPQRGRGLLAPVAKTLRGAAMTSDLNHAHQHEHEHSTVPSDPALRVKALESLLVEKGLVDPAALNALVDAYERKIGPRN